MTREIDSSYWSRTKKDIESVSEVTIRKARKDERGKNAMGTKFNVKEGVIAADYKDKNYYLCCVGCIEPFKKNSEKYLKNS